MPAAHSALCATDSAPSLSSSNAVASTVNPGRNSRCIAACTTSRASGSAASYSSPPASSSSTLQHSRSANASSSFSSRNGRIRVRIRTQFNACPKYIGTGVCTIWHSWATAWVNSVTKFSGRSFFNRRTSSGGINSKISSGVVFNFHNSSQKSCASGDTSVCERVTKMSARSAFEFPWPILLGQVTPRLGRSTAPFSRSLDETAA
mmetsp:Transcript_17729/g.55532  ORF Transcript_17729/g.55532 Transcript_17729/m.55532 type:complete len:205 (+) Transcript_17729:1671-2285(+)